MLFEMNGEDFSSLLLGHVPGGFQHADTPVASTDVLRMLADVAAKVRLSYSPASWLIVEDGEAVGLCLAVRPPTDGRLEIGYGVTPSRRGRGIAGRAVAEIVAWARTRPELTAVIAETNPGNEPSQKVLSKNGFRKTGQRIDDEDGPLICWYCPTG